MYPGLQNLYDDKDVCAVLDCDLYKNLQPIYLNLKKGEDFGNYSSNLRKNIYNYLYGDKSAEEVLSVLAKGNKNNNYSGTESFIYLRKKYSYILLK